MVKYPNKVLKECFCPLRSNAFVIPPACLVLLAFCSLSRFPSAATFAKVIFWIGAPLTLAISLYMAARWITDLHSVEHLNAAWLLPPTACFVCAGFAPFIDVRYTEAAYLWFGFGVATGLPVYIITLHRSITFGEPDDRNRLLKWTWAVAPAIAFVAQVSLSLATETPEIFSASVGGAVDSAVDSVAGAGFSFGFGARVLYFIALSIGMVLGLLFLTGHASRLKFDAAASWGLAFPLEGLALATIVYAVGVPGLLPRGMAYAGLAVASTAVLVLTLHTIQALFMGGVFISDPKYGPLSQQILTHEAFRVAGERLKAAVSTLDPYKSPQVNAPALADFALQFKRYRLAHAWHARQEEDIIFKEFENYAPTLCSRQHNEHFEHEEIMERWAGLIDFLETGDVKSGGGDPAQAIETLRSEIAPFIDDFENHLRGEEMHLQRGGRKHLNADIQRQMIQCIWDATPMEVWAEFFPFVVSNLPMHQQRVKFVRCFATWAVPERAQLIGRFIALGVDAVLWHRLVQSVPEIIPRGEKGWRRYY